VDGIKVSRSIFERSSDQELPTAILQEPGDDGGWKTSSIQMADDVLAEL
jgi:hypothetical protein